jgi:hypothetical protein
MHRKSKCSTGEEYATYMSRVAEGVKVHVPSSKWLSPHAVIGDYEQALRAGTYKAFPSATYMGDSFHFVQANFKWVRARGGRDRKPKTFFKN